MAIDGKAGSTIDSFKFLNYDSYCFSTGPASLALKTGAAIVPAFIVRDQNLKNHLIFEKEMTLDNVDSEAAVDHHTKKFIGILENYVRNYPDHYGMELFFEKRRLAMVASERQGETSF